MEGLSLMKLKRYRVECTQRYIDESHTETEVVFVSAYDREHAEEKAFDLCGGESGLCSNMEFHATLSLN